MALVCILADADDTTATEETRGVLHEQNKIGAHTIPFGMTPIPISLGITPRTVDQTCYVVSDRQGTVAHSDFDRTL